jgi:hypothetical protein
MNRKPYLSIFADIFAIALVCLAMGFLASCGSSGSNIAPQPVINIAAKSGFTATAAVNSSFGTLSATVTSNGSPASGVSVTFTAPSSGASGLFATSTPAVTDTETTNASGVATSQIFTANATTGSYSVTATTSGATTPASFALTNTAGAPPPPTIAITADSGYTATAGVDSSFGTFSATVTSNGSPASGVSVTFTAPASGASGLFATTTPAVTDTETTNSNGIATSQIFTANATTGSYAITASTSGATTPASFGLTNTAGAPPPTIAIAANGGYTNSAPVGTSFGTLSATVTSNGLPANGVSVTFTAPASGASGTFANSTVTETDTTNASGVAISSAFTANLTLGSYSVTASTSGATPANFALTNTVGAAAILTATSGGGQSAPVTTTFTNRLVATVTDAHNNPLNGVSVTFTAPASGASGSFGPGSPTVTTDTELTGANGQATSQIFTANVTAGGPYNVVASSAGVASVNFAETNTAGAAAVLAATSGGGQSATVSTAFTLPLVATVTDAHNNPVSGVSVTFTAPASGASGTFATTPPATTDTEVTGANGQATSHIFTANSTAGGPYNVVASSAGLTSVNFAETNTVGTPANLTATSGGGQSAKVVTPFTNPLVATVTDAHGNLLSGVSVTFTAPASGASSVFETTPPSGTDTEVTGANGQATSQKFGATSTAGSYNIVASSGSLTPVNFAETNTAAAASTLTATSGEGQSATVSTAFAFPLVATATDGHGNPVSGVSVTFTAPASGASGLFATTPPATTDTEVTGSNGQATSHTFTANSTAGGPYNVVASSTGLTSANFAETNTANTTGTLTATSGGAQSATVSTAFALPLVATVTNSGGNPVSGVSVTFTAPASGASGLFATTPPSTTDTETTNASGQATSHVFGANATAGSYNVVASSAGLTSVNFAETNTAGAATTLAATSGGGQSAQISTAFTLPLVATVTDAHSNPVSGVSVTFTAPGSGASGLFATTPASTTDTEVTGSNGQATSKTFTANSTAGGPYNVVASSTGLTSVNFAETNTTGAPSSNTYVFYASGQDSFEGFENYYAIAGAVTIDASGNVTAGEQDYNDGNGDTSPKEPTADTITGGTLTVNPTTGQGTLTLTTNNNSVGSPLGTEVFAVQFVNNDHALIAEFDGWATSSGSLDLQTATTASTGTFAFALSGVDPSYNSVAYGGVFNTTSGVTPNVILDINDDGSVKTDQTFTATSSTPDTFGRSTVTGISNPVTTTAITFASYVVGPEVMRIIDIDTDANPLGYDAAVGSAYGQGSTTTFTNATFPTPSVASGVFALLGQSSEVYATLGEFTTNLSGGFTSGLADDNELDNGIAVEADSIVTGSSYNFVGTAANGYGTMSITWGTTGPSVSTLGVYMVDPTLNINDPNNATSADVGGALVVDLDGGGSAMPGGIGVITPQTSTATASFNGTYVAGFQDFNDYTCLTCEFDSVSLGTMTAGAALSLTGDASDPFGLWTGTPAESTGDTFTSTPLSVGTGIYSMSAPNSNPLEATIDASAPFALNVDIYQASATTLYWLEFDNDAVFLGPIEKQGSSLSGIPGAKHPAGQAQAQPNKNTKPMQRLGGTLR